MNDSIDNIRPSIVNRRGVSLAEMLRRRGGNRRGTADIELLLSVTIFITLLMLVRGAMSLMLARIGTSEEAAFGAFHDATAADPPVYADGAGPAPVDGIGVVRPGMPNRVHTPEPRRYVTVYSGDSNPMPLFEVGSSATVAGPPWIFSARPAVTMDAAATERWFLDWVDESHAEFIEPLGLAEPWTP